MPDVLKHSLKPSNRTRCLVTGLDDQFGARPRLTACGRLPTIISRADIWRSADPAEQQILHQRLLHMHAVLGLVPDD